MSPSAPPTRLGRAPVYLLVVASVIVTAHLSGVRLGPLLDTEASTSAWAILQGLTSPNLEPDFLWRICKLSVESILIGVLATTLAALLGVALALVSIKVPKLEDSPERTPYRDALAGAVRFVVRAILAVFRSIPDIVWAFLFVRMFGLGPGAAVLAIAISTGGIFGKLFSELAEAVEPESIRAMRRLGVGRPSILIYGVLPQVWRQWVGYAFYRFECSFRSASIVGVVGAGGLGSEIALSVRYFEFDKLGTALLAVLVFVIAIEMVSSFLRRRPFKLTVGLAIAASVVALVQLDIPWSAITLASLSPEWLTDGRGSDAGAFVFEALKLVAQTVAMAWCATWVAAAIALPLSPLTNLASLRGARRDSLQGRSGPSRAASWVVFGIARLFMQVCRAMPELTLALVFVLWVGPGAFAGVLAICVHTIGVLGRLYSDVYEEVEPATISALENCGLSRFAIWLYGIFPQSWPRLLAFTLYRFEVNVRATAMVGFVGAGGIGASIDTAMSLFHGKDLLLLLGVLFALVVTLDFFGDRIRYRILTRRFQLAGPATPPHGVSRAWPTQGRRRAKRYARAKRIMFRARGAGELVIGTVRSASAGGLFIETVTPVPAETIIEIDLDPTSSRADRTLYVARVVYTRQAEVPGMGVEMLDRPPGLVAEGDEQE